MSTHRKRSKSRSCEEINIIRNAFSIGEAGMSGAVNSMEGGTVASGNTVKLLCVMMVCTVVFGV